MLAHADNLVSASAPCVVHKLARFAHDAGADDGRGHAHHGHDIVQAQTSMSNKRSPISTTNVLQGAKFAMKDQLGCPRLGSFVHIDVCACTMVMT